ncbi:MAG: sugar transferase [Fibrobacteres bacterium]|nr:sugar transferase [Fibrobacterota bacterium]
MTSLRAAERAAFIAADFLGGCLAVAAVFWLRYRSGILPEEVDLELDIETVFSLVVLPIGWMFWFFLHGMYRDWFLESRTRQILVLFAACSLGALGLFLVMAGSDLVAVLASQDRTWAAFQALFTRSRMVTVGGYGASMLLFPGALRLTVQGITRSLLRSGKGLEAAILLGANDQGNQVLQRLRARPILGIEPVAFLDPDAKRAGKRFDGLRIAGKYSDLPRVLDETGARHVVICHSTSSHNEILRILSFLDDRSVTVYVVPDLFDVLSGHLRTVVLHQADLLVLLQHHLPGWQAGMKRLMDLAFSVVILLAALPALLLAMLAIKLDSPGPIFYSQERVGQYGRRFRVWKLRTMRTDAEKSGPQWAGKKDNRITKVGKFLRKTRLDEVPQLWCVFRGDMALVGPRPEREFFIEKLRDEVPLYVRRLKMKPGLTGWAQVTLGYDNSIEDVKKKVMADLWYFENLSLSLDIQILVRTIWVVLTGKGAN